MPASAPIKRLSFLLAFATATLFSTVIYWLFFHSILEMGAIPRQLTLAQQLAQANDPALYQKICRLLVNSVEQAESTRLAMIKLLRAAICFFIVSSGVILLLSFRLLQLSSKEDQETAPRKKFAFPGQVLDFLIAAGDGKLKPWQALTGTLLPALLIGSLAKFGLGSALHGSKEIATVLPLSTVAGGALVLYLFALNSLWRCAANARRKIWTWGIRLLIAAEGMRIALRIWLLLPAIAMMWRFFTQP